MENGGEGVRWPACQQPDSSTQAHLNKARYQIDARQRTFWSIWSVGRMGRRPRVILIESTAQREEDRRTSDRSQGFSYAPRAVKGCHCLRGKVFASLYLNGFWPFMDSHWRKCLCASPYVNLNRFPGESLPGGQGKDHFAELPCVYSH